IRIEFSQIPIPTYPIHFTLKLESFSNISTFTFHQSTEIPIPPASEQNLPDDSLPFSITNSNLTTTTSNTTINLSTLTNVGETNCTIHIDFMKKDSKSSLGWKTKGNIPILSLPHDDYKIIKEAKFCKEMMLGYRIFPYAKKLSKNIYQLPNAQTHSCGELTYDAENENINNSNQNINDDFDNISQYSLSDNEDVPQTPGIVSYPTNIIDHNRNDDSSVSTCNEIEFIYLTIPKESLLGLMDSLDRLADNDIRSG
ncbi:35451_t:CDS:2, partial [Racocetra persica]